MDENIELRIIIIGDENVGKKTLTKRILMLNSSITKQIDNKILLYNESKEEKRKKKLKKMLYRSSSSKQEISIIEIKKQYSKQKMNL